MSRVLKFKAYDIEKDEVLDVEDVSYDYVTLSPKDNDDEGNLSYQLRYKLYDDGSGTIEAYVMQYIGLEDKNDTEIYESYLIEDYDGDGIHEVVYFEDQFCLRRPYDGKIRTPNKYAWWDTLIVSGNKYLNKGGYEYGKQE